MRRILVDECINPRLAPRIRSSLPRSSVDRYDVFLTIDKSFEFEHDLKKFSFGIIVLTTANNQMPSYERILEELVRQIQHLSPGHAVHVIHPDC